MFSKINRVSIEFTKKCNLRCVYCHQDRSDETISYSNLEKRIDFINSMKNIDELNVDISLTGGEVTVEEEKFIKYHRMLRDGVRFRNKTFSMMSNMTNLSPVLLLLSEGVLRPDRVGFSWDGVRGTDTRRNKFGDEFFRNKLMELAGSKWKDDVFIQLSVHPDVIPYLAESVEFLRSIGLTNTGTYLIRGYEYTDSDAELYSSEMNKICKIFEESYINDVKRLRYFEFTKCWMDYVHREKCSIDYTTKCRKLGRAVHIAMDDKLYPCIYFGDHGIFDIGNIQDGINSDSISEFKNQYNEKSKCIENNSCTIKHCSSCEAVNFHKRGHLQSKDESHCKMRYVEKMFFLRLMSNLYPYITETAIKSYWGKVNEQAVNPERL